MDAISIFDVSLIIHICTLLQYIPKPSPSLLRTFWYIKCYISHQWNIRTIKNKNWAPLNDSWFIFPLSNNFCFLCRWPRTWKWKTVRRDSAIWTRATRIWGWWPEMWNVGASRWGWSIRIPHSEDETQWGTNANIAQLFYVRLSFNWFALLIRNVPYRSQVIQACL